MSALDMQDRVNADLSVPARSHARDAAWTPSPMGGVHRRMLDRIGGEVARATSVVRYDANSRFSAHEHSGGEEFLVLAGTFQDEHGDYPAGTYVRNPVGTSHTPFTDLGCTILVKLWQFDPADTAQFSVDTAAAPLEDVSGHRGLSRLTLFEDPHECVRIEKLDRGTRVPREFPGGMEFFVLDGSVSVDGETFDANDWLRLPAGSQASFDAGSGGARYWIKTGHLAEPRMGPAA